MKKQLSVLFSAALLAVGSEASAQDSADKSMFSVSGFGTVGVAQSNNDQADFVSSVFRPNGAGASRRLSSDVDSKLGIQVTASINEQWTGVVQLISQQRYNNSYRPSVEWANLSYKITPDLNVRVGRVVWPLFTRSDSMNVGYSNFSIRSSAELAATIPNPYSDGVDASYRFKVGSTTQTLTGMVGKSRVNYAGEAYLDVKNIRGLSHVIDYNELTMHLAYMNMDYIFGFPGGSPLPVNLPVYSIGGVYDTGKWFVTGDLLRAPDPYYGRIDAFSLLGGMRFGAVSPYIGYSQFTQSTFGPGSAQLTTPTQSTSTVGVRWDFMKNTALKVQFDQIKSGDVANAFPISFINLQPGFQKRPNANIVSAVVDFVF